MNNTASTNSQSATNPFSVQIMSTKIRKLREMYGYPQEYVAFQMGISQAAYSKKEAGRTELSLFCLHKVALIYGLSIVDLISLTAQELLLKVLQSDTGACA
jgi:transcriptional regulator with XRE-family HTH domain